MLSSELESLLIKELGYLNSEGFLHGSYTPEKGEIRELQWNIRDIPGIDGVYLIQNTPIAYFSKLRDADPKGLWELHKRVWNQSRVPILFVVLPNEIRIYNSYAEPTETERDFSDAEFLLKHLSNLVDIETARQAIQNQLFGVYDRLYLDTGAFWLSNDGQRIKRHTRADQRLLRDMINARNKLKSEGLNNEIIYAILGRSIFICYLEDCGILTQDWELELTDGKVNNYRSALSDLELTYTLFERLSSRFNGDIFPILPNEREEVTQNHLFLLASFLNGTDLETGQTSFWPYDFNYIPIELISGIYDYFLEAQERREAGTYYTPIQLVDFILDETMSIDTIHPNMKVFDPACGSGIFLVKAFHKLVSTWERANDRKISVFELRRILQENIFGVDIKAEAVRIAAFSLYLAMLDKLPKEDIQNEQFRFPALLDRNLFAIDFFDPNLKNLLNGCKFDRVVGNPPWGRGTLNRDVAKQLHERGFTVGGKQIVQAFLAYAPDFCSDSGEVALLAPAKSTILLTSSTHSRFREQFFDQFNVLEVINFSALVYELFEEAKSPAVAIYYNRNKKEQRERIIYGVPKPSSLSHQLGAIVLDSTEVKALERKDIISNTSLWKIALWGTARDELLIRELKKIPKLEEQAKLFGWIIREGLIEEIAGHEGYTAPWLLGKPLLPVYKFRR